jgi:hypothetical protein
VPAIIMKAGSKQEDGDKKKEGRGNLDAREL